MLAADPTWIYESIAAYYDFIDILVVSFDCNSKSWTGSDIPVDECRQKIREIDSRCIIVDISDDYSGSPGTPIQRDTSQRQACIDYLSTRVDWIIQIDTDELMPDIRPVLTEIQNIPENVDGIEWPMRVLYRQLSSNSYLGVSNLDSNPVYEYPGPIVVRKNVTLVDARRISTQVVRYSVIGDTSSLQLKGCHIDGIQIRSTLDHSSAIVHNSWARSPKSVWRKVRSWGHNDGLKSLLYFVFTWLPSPVTWRYLRNIHPFAKGLWPKLTVITLESVGD